jgi:beta-ureidopropionase
VAIVKAGLIQMALKVESSLPPNQIREAMLDAHEPLIKKACSRGVQVLCLQEVFNQPYFPPSRDRKWFEAAESIPDGPTTIRLQELATIMGMVIVAPIFEEEMPGVYYNTAAVIDADGKYLGKYRKTHIPDIVDWPEKFFFKPGNLGYPVFDTAFCKLGVYICYDRHFPEGWRALALNRAEYVVNPSATAAHSRHIWELEQPTAAVANGYFVGAINRVGTEAPWNIGKFFGHSYFADPKGRILAQAGDKDELLEAELNLELIKEIRQYWQFFRDRRPETYRTLADNNII